MIEGIVFVPFTNGSKLRNMLQKAEDMITGEMRVPSVRFVERGGKTVEDTLGRSNPWKSEHECARKKCPPCWGRRWIAAQKE